MRILVTGGAGYVGSHASRLLERKGHDVWVYDNLNQGHREAVKSNRLLIGDLSDRERLTQIFVSLKIEAVMHFAALSLVGESMTQPAKYYQNNVVNTLHLFEAMRTADVSRIVFSSTTATYGVPNKLPITEEEPQKPINPYGFGKLAIEQVLKDFSQAYGWSIAALRYFNACGASAEGDLGEDHTPETHLIPLVLQVARGQRPTLTIFGDDYPTADGTCIRDYIHVDDLAWAHCLALEQLSPEQPILLNLGSGVGYSVTQIVNMCRDVTGQTIPTLVGPRRPGDPPELVADPSKAAHLLGWKPIQSDLRTIVESAWRWHSAHPQGYATPNSNVTKNLGSFITARRASRLYL